MVLASNAAGDHTPGDTFYNSSTCNYYEHNHVGRGENRDYLTNKFTARYAVSIPAMKT